MSTAIRVENLSKQYRLGAIGTGSLVHDLKRWWALTTTGEDPYLKIGEANDRATKGNSDYVWALRDINFEVEQGEVLGIIGKNGAGKSTLLKILSRVTKPTTGSIKVKGRIASLLEVGTGFHPELTGRENIFLNGAILGMTKAEIRRKFDEIVDFAGVDRYIDTPVKRYSSGMYVRLAFAVAAHLEPEILIVDEVLAVGDAEFQKKALGKMQDVSKGEGRTVLFVSHNMAAVERLCKKVLYLEKGGINNLDFSEKVINDYLNREQIKKSFHIWQGKKPGDANVKLVSASLMNTNKEVGDTFSVEESICIEIQVEVNKEKKGFVCGLNVFTGDGIHLLSSHDLTNYKETVGIGNYKICAWIPSNLLAEGVFSVSVALMQYNPFHILCHEMDILRFQTYDEVTGNSARGVYTGSFPGVIRPKLKWDKIITQEVKVK